MRILNKPSRYHITHMDGIVTGAGGDSASPQMGETVLWFETRRARESYPGVSDYRKQKIKQDYLVDAEELKTDLAYAAKREQAQEIANGVPYNATTHDLIEIEVRLTNKAPMAVAQEILNAVKRDVYEKENKRVKAREMAKNL